MSNVCLAVAFTPSSGERVIHDSVNSSRTLSDVTSLTMGLASNRLNTEILPPIERGLCLKSLRQCEAMIIQMGLVEILDLSRTCLIP